MSPPSIPFKKLILESHRAVYFEVPKVACTTINFLLIRWLIRPHERFSVQQVHSDQTLPRQFGRLQTPYDQYFKFGFVRHPVSRLQSCFLDKVKSVEFQQSGLYEDGLYMPLKKYGELFYPGMSFEAFVASVAQLSDNDADPHFRSQSCFLLNNAGDLELDFVGRFENLAVDLSVVLERFGLKSGEYEIPTINKQAYPPSWELQSDLLSTIHSRYKSDFANFGYSLD